jgi:hypothetical protein
MTRLYKNPSPLRGAKEDILRVVEAWEAHRPAASRGQALFFCPVCTRLEEATQYKAKKYGAPKCPIHLADMVKFDEEQFRTRRGELAGLLRGRLDAVLEIFERAAEAYTPVPQIQWRLEGGGELVVKPDVDPTEFRYVPAADAIVAFFYRYSVDADRVLEEEARRLGVKYYAEVMPNGPAPPGYAYDRGKNLYVKEA